MFETTRMSEESYHIWCSPLCLFHSPVSKCFTMSWAKRYARVNNRRRLAWGCTCYIQKLLVELNYTVESYWKRVWLYNKFWLELHYQRKFSNAFLIADHWAVAVTMKGTCITSCWFMKKWWFTNYIASWRADIGTLQLQQLLPLLRL